MLRKRTGEVIEEVIEDDTYYKLQLETYIIHRVLEATHLIYNQIN
jgi:hypothetical protein